MVSDKGHDNPAFQSTGDVSVTTKPKKGQDVEASAGEENRAQWGNGLEFLMSCIAMSVGLGNIWRFPFSAYENGGGAFLIPYIIILLVIGRPLYYLEMVVGQFSSKGNVKMFRSIVPGMRGIGYGQIVSTICVATYYCSLMAITLYYLIFSFSSTLPWSECDSDWANCTSSAEKNGSSSSRSSSELYFVKTVLGEYSSIDNGIGSPGWKLTLLLAAAWCCVIGIAIKGVKSSGKFSYFLALFPYVIMVTLLIKASTLEGAGEGIRYFIEPQWEEILKPKVWYAAVTQCFFSLNVGFGSIVMYSSYNDFNHNIYRDALVVSVMDTFTSLLAGFTIFGILGNLAHELGVDVSEVVKTGGSSLAFISYPEAIAKFDWCPQLFAVLFFFMLFVLGMGSLVALHGNVCTVVNDQFPSLKPWMVASGTAIAMFLVGLIYVTPGGQFMLNLVDYFGGTFIVYILTIAEVVAIIWIYGLENLCLDIEFMLKRKTGIYWRLCWAFITPVFLMVILLYALIDMEPLKYGSASYPTSATVCGWLLLSFGVAQIPIWCLWYMHHKRAFGFPDNVKMAFHDENWGPSSLKNKNEWIDFKKQAWDERAKRKESTPRYLMNILIGR